MKFIKIELAQSKKAVVRQDQIAAVEQGEWRNFPHEPNRTGFFMARIFLVGGAIFDTYSNYEQVLKEWCE